MKRLLEALGHETGAARDVFKTAYKFNILAGEKAWIDILEDRNKTSHTYDKKMAEELVAKVKARYSSAFHNLVNGIKQRAKSLE